MKYIRVFLTISILILVLNGTLFAGSMADKIVDWGIAKGSSFINPAIQKKFLFETDNRLGSLTPVEDNYVRIETSLLPYDFAFPNITLGIRVLKETKKRPNITIGGSYWDLVWVRMSKPVDLKKLTNDYGVEEFKLKGYSGYITIGKEIKKDVNIVGGYKYYSATLLFYQDTAVMQEKMPDVADIITTDKIGRSIDNGSLLFIGLRYKFSKTGSFITNLGYDPINHIMFNKVFFSWSWFDVGFTFFPDATLFSLYPIIRFHFKI